MALDRMTTAVAQRAADLEPLLLAELEMVFADLAEQASQTLTAAADWALPDGDELYDAARLEQLLAEALEQAKLELDTSVSQQVPGAPPGDYDTDNLAARVAARHRGEVARELLDGWNAGLSVDQMASRLAAVGQSSAQLVAQTSLIGMSNAGSLAGALYAGVHVKEWLTAGDDRVRPSHQEMEGEQVPVDAMFSNSCRFPGDPFGPGDETWNCRCALIYPEPDPATTTLEQPAPGAGYQSPSQTLTGWDDTKPISMTGHHVMDVIDRTHRVPGQMPRTPVVINQKGQGAAFHAGVRETWLEISEHAKWPNMSIAHEYGHKLDYAGSPGWFSERKAAVMTTKTADGEWIPLGPELSEAMTDWLKAVRRSSGYKTIETERAGYFKDVKELWARSYYQWVATRSGDRALLDELADVRSQAPGSTYYWPQWEDDDFVEIAAAIDRVMRERGLID